MHNTHHRTSICSRQIVDVGMIHQDGRVDCPILLQRLLSTLEHPKHKPHKFVVETLLGLFPVTLDENLCNEKNKAK